MTPDIWEIDEEKWYEQIFKEYHKTKDDLKEDINILKKWSETQPHFPEEPSDYILKFVILFNKFSIEKAKQKLDMYYTIRSLMPEFYKSQPFSKELVLQSKVVYIVPLPKTAPDLIRVIYSQVNPNFGPEFFNHAHMMEYFNNLVELLIMDDKCYNFHYIFDWNGVKLAHLPKFSPMIIRKASIVLEKVYSNRLASMHMVNFHPFMENVLNNIIKPMLHPKIRDRLVIHQSPDVLLEIFGKSVMPKDIGGEEKSLEELTDCIFKKFEARKDRFQVLGTLRVNESLRPEKLVNDDILGFYGNFKKLNVD